MNLAGILERLFIDKKTRAHREDRERVLDRERAELETNQQLLRGEVRQYEQIVESSSRIMNTMTHAMIMMENPRGRPEN
ncbi:hypothetical protein [Rhizobium sp. SSA_523]|uniref:hypothetical protein n=1 Tax=Rhizobium sp. SSA_523 TaxID=2952477 RepID=UPI0020916977|nr:hypothetical protein [Rhizobium sp. SSA_523]MCO5730061.1 hypothetical protein [Rhizobium sp. SSA_523]WKC25127.1 hypothetical protein QTJ18_14155 [Rhizobium sp. SSA_523]